MTFKKILQTSVAVAGVAAAFVAVPGSASASFGSGHVNPCQNPASIAGVGASFQRDAQLAWGATLLAPNPGGPNATGFGYLDLYNASTNPNGHGCASFAIGGGKTVSYEPKGSGDGRKAFGASTVVGEAGVRNTNYAFGGADEPPTAAQLVEANNGADHAVGGGDDAVLHTIPVAQSAVAVDVKLPAGCTLTASSTTRAISRDALEGVFAARSGYTQWGQILPSIVGPGCTTKPIQRVVRQESSGTTFAFKNYLRSIAPNGSTDFPAPTSANNTVWPNDSGSTAVVRPSSAGAGPLLDTLAGLTDGGIGYADLATSRAKAFDWVTGGSAGADDKVWLYVERAPVAPATTGTYVSPAVNNNAGVTGANKGSKCLNVDYQDGVGGALPATTASWANVNAVSTTSDYAICALTYALAWERPSLANNGSLQPLLTEDQARAVRDYLAFDVDAKTAIGSTPVAGQSQLAAAGYQQLPDTVRTKSMTGVSSLTW